MCPPAQKTPLPLLGSNADCRRAGRVPDPQPSAGTGGAKKSLAAKAVAPAQRGLSPTSDRCSSRGRSVNYFPQGHGEIRDGLFLELEPQPQPSRKAEVASNLPSEDKPPAFIFNPVHSAPSRPGNGHVSGSPLRETGSPGEEQPSAAASGSRAAQVTA